MSETVNSQNEVVEETTETKPIENKEVDMVEKKALDKALKEKAELQRQLNAKKTEEERAKDEQAQKEKELEELRKFQKESILQKGLLAENVNPSDVAKISDAVLSGEVDKIATAISEAVKNAKEEAKKEVMRDALNETPLPQGNTNSTETTAMDFKKMTLDERIELKNTNPDLYKKLKNS